MSDVTQTSGETGGSALSKAGTLRRNWFLLRQFNYYRIGIAIITTGIALLPVTVTPFGIHAPQMFSVSALAYLLIAVFGMAMIQNRHPEFQTQVISLAIWDIILITLLMHASGGLSSGLGLLLLVAVAECGVLVDRRRLILLASLATLAVLVEHSWTHFYEGIQEPGQLMHGYTQVAIMGVGFFVTATLVNTLADRLHNTTLMIERQELSLSNMGQVNDLIIQNMQSGVVVCDSKGMVRALNDAAQTFLGIQGPVTSEAPLATLTPELAEQLSDWISKPIERTRKLLRTGAGYTLMPRFIFMGDERRHSGVVIFLEDTEVLRQQAQQLKMAALARLAASVAHEVRNPLSAISNAAQLLQESTDDEDAESRRLLQMIMDHGKRVNVIIENITQLSRRDRTSRERLPLYTWTVDFVRQYAQGSEVPAEAIDIITEAGDIEACVDPNQIYQVVANLCQNAIRHSPAYEGSILVRLQIGADKSGRPYLDVIDWGKGVPPEIAQNIFDPFFTTTAQGTGLGLYISRELCEGNGAMLQLLPAPERGSQFRITFAKAEECGDA